MLEGQYDINLIRNNAAEDYVHSCQGLWIVAEINGAVDNQALHMAVSKFGGRFPNRLIVVLTKACIFDKGVLKRLRDDGVDMTEHDFLEEKFCNLQNQIANEDRKLGRPNISTKKYEQARLRKQGFQIDLNEAEESLYATGLHSEMTLSSRNCSRSWSVTWQRTKISPYWPRAQSTTEFTQAQVIDALLSWA